MRIILSRKGFDSTYGGVPSPIHTPTGEMYSLPIPENPPREHNVRYSDIRFGSHTAGAIVSDLTGGKISSDSQAHLDPDLNRDCLDRPHGWMPAFGQASAAERHLQNNAVQAGDVFLFYGWFREVQKVNGIYQYNHGAPNIHVIFGWLQVGRRICLDDYEHVPPWAHSHPHGQPPKHHALDSIYISNEQLRIPGEKRVIPGAGVFKTFHPQLQLTARGASRSLWKLPLWLFPGEDKPNLTYHQNAARWHKTNDSTLLQTVSRGQEFVLDGDRHPEAIEWLSSLLRLSQ
ncbi:MAG: hypothetical protein RLZZ387_2094 [Chloroflexota bacterium]|jgi:hypothetical protein